MTDPMECPSCRVSLDGGEIPEANREWYSPPYRYSRAIAVVDQRADRQVAWKCPDCGVEWDGRSEGGGMRKCDMIVVGGAP